MTEDVGRPGAHRAARRPGRVLTTVAALGLVLGGGTAVAVGVTGPGTAPAPPSLADNPSVTARPQAPTEPAAPGSVADAGASAPEQTTSAPQGSDAPEPGDREADARSGSTTSPPDDEPAEPLAPVAEPASVSIPAIGVSSHLLHLGLDDQGALAVPQGDDYDSAAWYDGSPRPGQDGPAVILGHVSGAAGPSVFFDLARLQVGDTVEVSRADGTTATFEIYDLQQYPKDTFPTTQVYGNTTGPELR
uniref:sortase domain-containing protein n=1 Tax=Serinicoccus sediminis TaxID=2306021 RepID=UPI00102114DC